MKKISLSTTMGPGVVIDQGSLEVIDRVALTRGGSSWLSRTEGYVAAVPTGVHRSTLRSLDKAWVQRPIAEN